MGRNRNTVDIGARDYCRNCGKIIELMKGEGLYQMHWEHQVTKSHVCEKDDIKETAVKHRAQPENWCWESMAGGSWYSPFCGRRVKNKELYMCGIHASHKLRADAKAEAESEHYDLNRHIESEVWKICNELMEEWGEDLEARPFSHLDRITGLYTYTGQMVVNPARIKEILDSLQETFE